MFALAVGCTSSAGGGDRRTDGSVSGDGGARTDGSSGGGDGGGTRTDGSTSGGEGGTGGMLCTDTCSTANDMECDDGGPDSLYSLCEFGTDCADCGPRDPAICGTCGTRECGKDDCGRSCGECPETEYCGEGSMCAPRAGTDLCNNECQWANDGACDDGGPMSMFSVCAFGSDCFDCGMRNEADRPADAGMPDAGM